jgi:hypothetical protein
VRTTLNLDEDVLLAVKERARRERRSAGAVLSALARQALTSEGRADDDDRGETFHGFEPFPHRGRAVSNEIIDRLREEDDE